MSEAGAPKGPDLSRGVPLASIPREGVLAGRVGDQPVLLMRRDDGLFAVGGACTHYGGPLAEGLVSGDTVRCPWHHACFDLRTGAAHSAPAFDPLPLWRVDVEGARAFVREPLPRAPAVPRAPDESPGRIVIVGGGAAGFSAAEMLRRRGYAGSLTLLSADADPPCDRPNLSKDYLAGTAPEDWIPLRPADWYAEQDIQLRLGVEVERLDLASKEAVCAGGERVAWDALLLATGAEPVRPRSPGLDLPNVHVLRSLADSRRLIAACAQARTAVVVGASFIGLEAAAALGARGLEVHVVAPETIPFEKVLGRELGETIAELHRAHGVRFHLGQMAESFDGRALTLMNGDRVEADLVVLGVGVRPRTGLAETSGLAVESGSGGGVLVDAQLRASAPGVWAAGDIARYPDPRTGEPRRIEHWVHACRMGQVAAANMLGAAQAFTHVPFFWSNHYELAVRYVGHAAPWHSTVTDGSTQARDVSIGYYRGQKLLAAASVGRDRQNLQIEAALEDLTREPMFPPPSDKPRRRPLFGFGRAPRTAPQTSAAFPAPTPPPPAG